MEGSGTASNRYADSVPSKKRGLTGDFAIRSRATALTEAAALVDEETYDPAAERDEAPFRRQE